MMKLFKAILVLLLAGALASCGGGKGCGGSEGTSPFAQCEGTTPVDGGGGEPPAPVAADLSIVLSKTVVNNSGTDTVTVTATAVDQSRNAVSGIPVSFSVDANAVAAAGGTATDTKGSVEATVSIGADKSNRTVTVSVVSGTLRRSAQFVVTGAKLTATAVPAVVQPGSNGNKVRFVLQDVNDNPIGNQPIAIAAPQGTVQGATAADGSFEFGYVAPTTAGKYTVTGTAAGVSSSAEIEVQAAGGGSTRDPVTVVIRSASVTANPSVVGVNEPNSQRRSTRIRALFLGASNAPIKDVRVRFDLNGDPNSIGGTFSTGNNITFSEADGVAVADYFPGTRSSPTNGVLVRACYGPTDASLANNACPNSALTTLTVTSEPLSVSIGTDNTISNGAGGLTYIKRYVVMVVDSSGQAISNVEVTPSIDILRYYKGEWGALPPGTIECAPGVPPTEGICQTSLASQGDIDPFTRSNIGCLNEDINRNGVLETQGGLGLGGTEDFNGNGALDPRKSDISIRAVGTNRTDESGVVIVQIEYPESVATWLRFRILVSASGVSGTEGRATFDGITSAVDTDYENPAFARSPYGTSASCANKE